MTGLSPVYLAVTILASGNSVADLAGNMAIAKRGLARMAITGCIAGPMFNFQFGLGLSTLLMNI